MTEPYKPTGSPEFDKWKAEAWRIQQGQEDNACLSNATTGRSLRM